MKSGRWNCQGWKVVSHGPRKPRKIRHWPVGSGLKRGHIQGPIRQIKEGSKIYWAPVNCVPGIFLGTLLIGSCALCHLMISHLLLVSLFHHWGNGSPFQAYFTSLPSFTLNTVLFPSLRSAVWYKLTLPLNFSLFSLMLVIVFLSWLQKNFPRLHL